jgi:polyhydroxyalkanoate synthesis repressor PhaR
MDVIKRYPNRKLYSTNDSCYVTLEELHKKVLNDEPFTVVDHKTKTEITRKVLCKILHKQDMAASFYKESLIARIKAHPIKELK